MLLIFLLLYWIILMYKTENMHHCELYKNKYAASLQHWLQQQMTHLLMIDKQRPAAMWTRSYMSEIVSWNNEGADLIPQKLTSSAERESWWVQNWIIVQLACKISLIHSRNLAIWSVNLCCQFLSIRLFEHAFKNALQKCPLCSPGAPCKKIITWPSLWSHTHTHTHTLGRQNRVPEENSPFSPWSNWFGLNNQCNKKPISTTPDFLKELFT